MPSPLYCRLDQVPSSADQFICGVAPSITARSFSSCPSDSISRWTPCPPECCTWWLQVLLGLYPAFAFVPVYASPYLPLSPASDVLSPLLDIAPLIRAPEG